MAVGTLQLYNEHGRESWRDSREWSSVCGEGDAFGIVIC